MNNEPVTEIGRLNEIQRIFSRWENQIKDMKARRDMACSDRDAAITRIGILSTEIGSAQDALDRAKAEDRNKNRL
jgi:hypothetical protein